MVPHFHRERNLCFDFPLLPHSLRKGEHGAAFGAGWRWSSCAAQVCFAAEVCCAQRGLNPKLHPGSSQEPAKVCEHLHTELNLEDTAEERFHR